MKSFSRRRFPPEVPPRNDEVPTVAAREALLLVDQGNALETGGRLAYALECYEAAIGLAPGFARAHLNRGNALLDLARTDEAIDAYLTAIACDPEYASAYYNLGNAYARGRRHEAAVPAYRKALALKPAFVDAEVALGCALEEVGRGEEAVACYRRALDLQPTYAQVHGNLGHALQRLGRAEDAIGCFRQSLALDTTCVAVRKGLAGAQASVGRYEEAIENYVEVLRAYPDDGETLVALGNAEVAVGRIGEAADRYRRVLVLHPDLAGVHTGLGNALTFLGLHEEALASHRRALAIDPELAQAHSNLGNALYNLGRLHEAARSYREARRIKPELAQAHTGLLFTLCHDEAIGPEELSAEHRRYGEQFDAPEIIDRSVDRDGSDAERPLRVGFVSGDLRDHPVAYFLEPVLVRLAGDPRLVLHAYYNHATDDAVTARLRRHFAGWTRVVALSDSALAARIGDDRIDILIDLSGHTAGNRLPTLARKPAPVQASWLGYPGTTGLRSVDYYFADPCFLPLKEFAAQFTEKLVHLPASAPFLPYEAAPAVGRLPAMANGHLTFGSFNRLSKLRPAVIALWSRLLRALPSSRMVVGGMPGEGQYDSVVACFAAEGIEQERIRFYPRCGTREYLALHQSVDICLDAFPYTGGTTTAHALWMGVPTLSLAGPTAPARQGASILGHVGLDAFVARDPAEFVRTGLSLADDLGALADLRAGLRSRCERSAMHRPDLIAAGVEYALRTMWRRHSAGLPAQAIDATLSEAGDTA